MFSTILLQSTEMPKELFTKESLFTLIGLVGMVYAASNSLQRALNFNPKWLALVLAQILSILAVYLAFRDQAFDIINYVIGIFNGFLVYMTASGATSISDTNPTMNTELPNIGQPSNNRKFTSRWW